MKRLVLAGALSLVVAPAFAQTPQEGLVNVNIQDVLREIAVDLNIQDTNIPVVIQLPVSVAANVCDVSVNVLSAQVGTGDASCVAVTGSQELTQIVQQEMTTGGSGDAGTGSDTAGGTDTTETDTTGSVGDTDTSTEETAEAPAAAEPRARGLGRDNAPGRQNAPGQLRRAD